MSDRAFIDKERTISVCAKEIREEDKNKRYYCINPKCDAHLSICSLAGTYQPYFSAKDKDHPHIEGCTGSRMNLKKYDEAEFIYEDIIKKLMNSKYTGSKEWSDNMESGGKSKGNINNLLDLYQLCQSYGITQQYNQYLIGNIYLDDRSQRWYDKGVYGYKIIECTIITGKFYYRNNDGKRIICIKRMVNNQEYTFIMRYYHEKIFWEILNKIFIYKNCDIIIAGYWEKYKYNSFFSDIYNKAQLLFIKNGVAL